jgi:hypothetical protein
MSAPPSNAARTTAHHRPAPGLVAVVLALLLSAATPTRADPSRPPTSTRTAAVVVRSLAYDRSLVRRAGAHADLLVLSSPTRIAGERATFAPLASIGVQGLPLLVSTGAPATPEELRALIVTHHAEALFVDEVPPAVAAALRSVAREFGCIIFVRDRAALASGGHVAVLEEGGRVRLVVALSEARAARIEFAADLLKLAEVLR